MPVQRLMKFVESDNSIMVQVRWKRLHESGNKLGPLSKVYEDVIYLLLKLLALERNTTDAGAEALRNL